MKSKLKNEDNSFFNQGYQEKDESKRINLNDLLQRSKEEKQKMKRTNVLVFSAVLFSASLFILIINYL